MPPATGGLARSQIPLRVEEVEEKVRWWLGRTTHTVGAARSPPSTTVNGRSPNGGTTGVTNSSSSIATINTKNSNKTTSPFNRIHAREIPVNLTTSRAIVARFLTEDLAFRAKALFTEVKMRGAIHIPATMEALQALDRDIATVMEQGLPVTIQATASLLQKVIFFMEETKGHCMAEASVRYIHMEKSAHKLGLTSALQYCAALTRAAGLAELPFTASTMEAYISGLKAQPREDPNQAPVMPWQAWSMMRVCLQQRWPMAWFSLRLIMGTCGRWADIEFLKRLHVKDMSETEATETEEASLALTLNLNGLTKPTQQDKQKLRADHYVIVTFLGSEVTKARSILAEADPEDYLIPWKEKEMCGALANVKVNGRKSTLHSMKRTVTHAVCHRLDTEVKAKRLSTERASKLNYRLARHTENGSAPQVLPNTTTGYVNGAAEAVARLNDLSHIHITYDGISLM
jgi:hypothetical protein